MNLKIDLIKYNAAGIENILHIITCQPESAIVDELILQTRSKQFFLAASASITGMTVAVLNCFI